MKLYDLIRKYQFEDVFKCLKKIDKRSHRKSYLSAWNELLILEELYCLQLLACIVATITLSKVKDEIRYCLQ